MLSPTEAQPKPSHSPVKAQPENIAAFNIIFFCLCLLVVFVFFFVKAAPYFEWRLWRGLLQFCSLKFAERGRACAHEASDGWFVC
jgi:hypothetical protein